MSDDFCFLTAYAPYPSLPGGPLTCSLLALLIFLAAIGSMERAAGLAGGLVHPLTPC
jgi:hypothetical protein